jgi:hypothetical protein
VLEYRFQLEQREVLKALVITAAIKNKRISMSIWQIAKRRRHLAIIYEDFYRC